MARKLDALALVLVAAATLLHGSAAQTRYVVGDALGWAIPPNGPSTYSNWASNKTFKVGDTLGNYKTKIIVISQDFLKSHVFPVLIFACNYILQCSTSPMDSIT